jgi:guanylate kinase
MPGNLIVVSAPSGAGKTSLVQALLAADGEVELSISYTTRAPRPGEADGKDYHFVSLEKFLDMERRGEFLETAAIYDNRYGTAKSWLQERRSAGRDVVLEIDWQGARQVRNVYSDAVMIFILPPSIEALEQRLKTRAQDSAETISKRLQVARDEISHVVEFDYVIINDAFQRAARGLQAIVAAERLRRVRQLDREAALLRRLIGASAS